jgi:hypothetical protein
MKEVERNPAGSRFDAGSQAADQDFVWSRCIGHRDRDRVVKVAAAGALLDVPLGHKDDSWSFSHFVMAIADGGRLRNRCGTEPIR